MESSTKDMEQMIAALTAAVAAINTALKELSGYRHAYLKGAAREIARTIGKE